MPNSPFIYNGIYSKSIQSQLNIADTVYYLQGTVDPTSSAQNAPQGSIYLRTGGAGGSAYLKQDAGSTTNWTKLASGAPTYNVTTIAANTTLNATNDVVLCNAVAGIFTVTLPTATGSGKMYYIKKIDVSFFQVTIAANAGEFIDKASTQVITQPYTAVTLVDGAASNFYIL